jgi:hypothetical protein
MCYKIKIEDKSYERLQSYFYIISVRPFFAPLTALKKELDDELRKKDTEIPLIVHLSIYMDMKHTFKGF